MIQKLLGPHGHIPILIRDDDTNFFTKINMLDSIYKDAWERGFKTSLSVVPFQRGINDICVPPEVRTRDSNFSIADNKPLVNYLKDKIRNQSTEILQHGVSHDINKDGRGEFGKDLDKKKEIEPGRNIINQAFEVEPRFFVPPGEDITKHNLMTLLQSGFIPILRQTYFDSFLRNQLVPSYLKHIATKALEARYKNKNTDGNWAIRLVKPVVVTVKENKILWSLPSMKFANLSSIESLLKLTDKVIESCSITRSPVCLLNHYHIYYHDWNDTITRKDLFNSWKQMLKKFERLKFRWMVTFSELFERAIKIQNTCILKTGSKITIESKTPIRNFSFRTSHQLEPSSSLVSNDEYKILTIEELLPGRKIILHEKS